MNDPVIGRGYKIRVVRDWHPECRQSCSFLLSVTIRDKKKAGRVSPSLLRGDSWKAGFGLLSTLLCRAFVKGG